MSEETYAITVVVTLADGTKREVTALLSAPSKPVGAHVMIVRGKTPEHFRRQSDRTAHNLKRRRY